MEEAFDITEIETVRHKFDWIDLAIRIVCVAIFYGIAATIILSQV